MMSSQSSMNYSNEDDCGQQEENEGLLVRDTVEGGSYGIDDTAEKFQCVSLHKHTPKRGEELSFQKNGLWRQELKGRAAMLEKQLKVRWELEELIEEQLNRFYAHYNLDMVPTRLKDVAQLLMPSWTPPDELAPTAWLGDWRPSAILELVRRLPIFSSSTSSSSSPNSVGTEQLLSQLIYEIRIEEAILDEEMAEIQSKCILYLPFAPIKIRSGGAALPSVQSEFKKIERVITKAQKLRFKALELVLKKVLSETDAAEFLVAFEGIQDAIHQFAANQRFQKGPVTLPVKPLGST